MIVHTEVSKKPPMVKKSNLKLYYFAKICYALLMDCRFSERILNMQNIFSHIDSIQKQLATEVRNRGFDKVVVGLSGGIDSAVVVKLCANVFAHNLHALLLPTASSNLTHLQDAITFAKDNNITYTITSIAKFDELFRQQHALYPPLDSHQKMRIGNFCARMRMIHLYDFAATHNALVIGTSNKSEIMLGYGTLYGDLACAINPIGNFYKTQIFALAKALGISQHLIDKKPSADLFENQSDEGDLGYSYAKIDPFLQTLQTLLATKNLQLTNLSLADKSILATLRDSLIAQGFESAFTDSLLHRIFMNTFKAKMPTILTYQ